MSTKLRFRPTIAVLKELVDAIDSVVKTSPSHLDEKNTKEHVRFAVAYKKAKERVDKFYTPKGESKTPLS